MTTNKTLEMTKIRYILQRTITNPYLGLSISLLLIVPSLYIILEDLTVIRKEYISLFIGIPLYIKSLNRIFDDLLNLDKGSF